MAWGARSGLKLSRKRCIDHLLHGLNGLGSPFGIETVTSLNSFMLELMAKWPGEPVRD